MQVLTVHDEKPELEHDDIVITIRGRRPASGVTTLGVVIATALQHHFAGVKPVVVINHDGDFNSRRSQLNVEPSERHEVLMDNTALSGRIIILDSGKRAPDDALHQ